MSEEKATTKKQEDARHKAKQMLQNLAGDVLYQMRRAVSSFIERDEKLANLVIEKEDYIDNQYNLIESEIFEALVQSEDEEEAAMLRTALKAAKGLEKIADHAENIAKQTFHIINVAKPDLSLDLVHFYQKAKHGINRAIEGFTSLDVELAQQAAETESLMDDVYSSYLKNSIAKLEKNEQDPRIILTQLFVAKSLEKIGDAVLDISEEVLTLIFGERMKIHQYNRIYKIAGQEDPKEIDLKGIHGTRSGATIFKVEGEGHAQLLYKEGSSRKIRQEIEKLKRWREIDPALVPDIIDTHTTKYKKTLVTNYINGVTLQEIYRNLWWGEKEYVTEKLTKLLERIWAQTLRKRKSPFDAISQIRQRLDSVYAINPYFAKLRNMPKRIGEVDIPAFSDIMDKLEIQAPKLRAPFSVFIHGDFNTDNILFKPESETLQFVDVHRSRYGDYLQDLSVMMVSNIRFPPPTDEGVMEMEKINAILRAFGKRFALAHGDTLYDLRLDALLARSLITSTRFVGNFKYARGMYLKGIAKLESVLERLSD